MIASDHARSRPVIRVTRPVPAWDTHGIAVHVPPISMEATAKKKKDSSAAPDAAPADTKRRPFKTLRVEDCSASIWARDFMVQGESKRFFSVSFERSYKDRDGAWKYSKSFDLDSLGRLVALCQQASEIIADLERESELSKQA